MKNLLLPVSLFTSMAAPLAYAAPTTPAATPNDIAACLSIADNQLRLTCYDKIANDPSVKQQLQMPQPITTTSRDVLDLEKTLEASRDTKSAQVVLTEQIGVKHLNTPLSELFDLDENNPNGLLTIREHNSMYALPAWYNTSPNYYPHSPSHGTTVNDIQAKQKRIEGKFQFSFKSKLMQDLFKTKADLWFGYTQQSNWQMYNFGDDSAPFRNNDYQPEIFLTQPVKADLPWGGKLRMLGAGFVHHSNGQSRPASRSWNRVYAMAGMEWDKLTIVPRVWARVDPSDKSKDDNNDITDYMGFGDVRVAYQLDDKRFISSTLRYNPFHNKGAVELNYIFPIKGKLNGVIQGFHGYGENILDYNHKQTGIGIGVMFRGWDGI